MVDRRKVVVPVAVDRRRARQDRRAAPRHRANGTAVVLSWREAGQYRILGATLREIGSGGASALAEECPPSGVPVWFRVHGDETSPWIGATVAGTSDSASPVAGRCLFRIRFDRACPEEVLEAAVEGVRRTGANRESSAARRPAAVV